MSDLISRQWLMECVNEWWIKFDTEEDTNTYIHLVRDIAPSVQSEHKRGKWSFIRGNMFECTCCGTPYTTQQLNGLCNYNTGLYVPKFCPNCGADLQEDEYEIN